MLHAVLAVFQWFSMFGTSFRIEGEALVFSLKLFAFRTGAGILFFIVSCDNAAPECEPEDYDQE